MLYIAIKSVLRFILKIILRLRTFDQSHHRYELVLPSPVMTLLNIAKAEGAQFKTKWRLLKLGLRGTGE